MIKSQSTAVVYDAEQRQGPRSQSQQDRVLDERACRRDYSSAYLRRTYRDGPHGQERAVANLSALPDHVIDLIDAGLKGQQLVPPPRRSPSPGRCRTARRRRARHGACAGPARPAGTGVPAQRDLAMALVISRVVRAGSKLSTLTWWDDTTLGADLGVAEASTDYIYATMDWLEHRQDAIEAELARPPSGAGAEPGADGAVRPVQLVAGRPVLLPLAARG